MAADLHLGEAWIGPLGNMMRLPYVSSLEIDPSRASSEFRSAAGGRRMAFAPVGARQWQVGLPGLRPQEIGQLMELLEVNPGPHRWVDPVARAVNLLTPAQVRFDPGVTTITLDNGGSTFISTDYGGIDKSEKADMSIAPYWSRVRVAGVSTGYSGVVRLTDSTKNIGRVPVIPGTPVTISAHVSQFYANDVRVQTYFYDQYGSGIYGVTTSIGSAAGTWRSGAIFTPPNNAAAATFQFMGTGFSIFKPAVTWSEKILPWGPGMGVESVAAVMGGHSPQSAWVRGEAPSIHNTTLTVMEVS